MTLLPRSQETTIFRRTNHLSPSLGPAGVQCALCRRANRRLKLLARSPADLRAPSRTARDRDPPGSASSDANRIRACPHQRRHLIIDRARLPAVYQYKLLVAVRSFALNYPGPVPEESTAGVQQQSLRRRVKLN